MGKEAEEEGRGMLREILDLPLVAGFEDRGRGYRSRNAGGLQGWKR